MKTTSADVDVGEMEPLFIAGGNVNWFDIFETEYEHLSKN